MLVNIQPISATSEEKPTDGTDVRSSAEVPLATAQLATPAGPDDCAGSNGASCAEYQKRSNVTFLRHSSEALRRAEFQNDHKFNLCRISELIFQKFDGLDLRVRKKKEN